MTSQRVTDVIFKAFQACAASQGDCNNLTFGFGGRDQVTGENVAGFGYYEVCFITLLLFGYCKSLVVMLQVAMVLWGYKLRLS